MRTAEVAVVGAGIAGLVAARRMAEGGSDVVVVEARDRVGGRVHTVEGPDGHPVELGAQWVGPRHTHLRALLEEHRLVLRRPPRVGRSVHAGADAVQTLPSWRALAAGLGAAALLDAAQALLRLSALARLHVAVPPERSVADWLGDEVVTARAREALAAQLSASACLPAEQVGLRWLLHQLRACGGLPALAGAEQDVVAGGLGALAAGLAEGLDVRTGRAVVALNEDADAGVQVVGDGWSLRVRHVVLAVPPAHAEQLRPGAGAGREPGAVLKYVARYRSPGWRRRGLSGEAADVDGVVRGVLDAGVEDGEQGPAELVAFVTGAQARRLSALAPARRDDEVRGALGRLLGDEAGQPEHLHGHDWTADPWSLGGYTWPVPARPGDPPRDAVSPRVHLAGSERARVWPGYVEGAVESGSRIADHVLAALRTPTADGAGRVEERTPLVPDVDAGRVGAAFFAGMGAVALARPTLIPHLMGLRVAGPTGTSEIRGVYGGFGLTVAGSLLTGPPARRAGARAAAGVALLGMAAGRVVDAVVERRLTPTAAAVMAGETALGSALLRPARPDRDDHGTRARGR